MFICVMNVTRFHMFYIHHSETFHVLSFIPHVVPAPPEQLATAMVGGWLLSVTLSCRRYAVHGKL